MFINLAFPFIQTIIARFRHEKTRYDLTFTFIVSFSRDQGISHRASKSLSTVCYLFQTTAPLSAHAHAVCDVRTSRPLWSRVYIHRHQTSITSTKMKKPWRFFMEKTRKTTKTPKSNE